MHAILTGLKKQRYLSNPAKDNRHSTKRVMCAYMHLSSMKENFKLVNVISGIKNPTRN